MLWVRISIRARCTTLCDKVCQWLATGRWFSPVSSTNKTDHHDITEILLKVALNTIKQTDFILFCIALLHPNPYVLNQVFNMDWIQINSYSKMTIFIGYINNVMIKFQIYFTSHMHIAKQIMDTIPEWFHVSLQDCGSYKHLKCLFCFITYLFSQMVTLTHLGYWFILHFFLAFYLFKSFKSKWHQIG
jgi:hypothetical protein